MSAKAEVRTLHGGTVHISIPASVANDLGEFRKSMAAVAERIGCRTCFSGADCTFEIERQFLVSERLELNPQPLPPGAESPVGQRTTVTLPRAVANDLSKLQSLVATIAGRLGCQGCTSGLDILFRQELEFLVDENLGVRAAAP